MLFVHSVYANGRANFCNCFISRFKTIYLSCLFVPRFWIFFIQLTGYLKLLIILIKATFAKDNLFIVYIFMYLFFYILYIIYDIYDI